MNADQLKQDERTKIMSIIGKKSITLYLVEPPRSSQSTFFVPTALVEKDKRAGFMRSIGMRVFSIFRPVFLLI